ncbi:MAG: cupin domain-containing protein [Fibrobacter sp.]|nr:cupin domain-containing protein [Fibrobacter sp.]
MEQKGIPFNVADHITYAEGSVISKTLIDKGIGSITLFSFDENQGLSEHTSPFDAVVHVLDGESRITIGGNKTNVKAGEMIIMPANVPHSLKAVSRFKMMLIMIRAADEKSSSGPIAV